MKPIDSIGVLARVGLGLLILSLAGCVGGVLSYGGYDDGDDGPAFDYDTGVYEPGGFDYGWWGGGEYFGGPPVYGYGGDRDHWRWRDGHPGDDGRGGRFGQGDDHGHGGYHGNGGGFGHGPHPYRAAPPSRAIPSIPSGPRGGGFRGGGPRGGGRR
jgi:hypothetical protein